MASDVVLGLALAVITKQRLFSVRRRVCASCSRAMPSTWHTCAHMVTEGNAIFPLAGSVRKLREASVFSSSCALPFLRFPLGFVFYSPYQMPHISKEHFDLETSVLETWAMPGE